MVLEARSLDHCERKIPGDFQVIKGSPVGATSFRDKYDEAVGLSAEAGIDGSPLMFGDVDLKVCTWV